MNDPGKLLVAAGIVLVIVGAVMWKTGGLGQSCLIQSPCPLPHSALRPRGE